MFSGLRVNKAKLCTCYNSAGAKPWAIRIEKETVNLAGECIVQPAKLLRKRLFRNEFKDFQANPVQMK